MLPKVNRITSAAEFRQVFRKGRRFTAKHFAVVASPGATEVTRFGFVVSKKISKAAVTRNLVRRRMQAVSAEFLFGSTDVIVRALPGSETLTWDEFVAELKILQKAVR